MFTALFVVTLSGNEFGKLRDYAIGVPEIVWLHTVGYWYSGTIKSLITVFTFFPLQPAAFVSR